MPPKRPRSSPRRAAAPAPASASASTAGAADAVRAAGTDNEAKAPARGLDDPAFDCSVHIHASKTPRVINLSVERAAIDDIAARTPGTVRRTSEVGDAIAARVAG